MKITICAYCFKTYPIEAMENKKYCSTWCIERKKTGLSYTDVIITDHKIVDRLLEVLSENE